MADPEDPGSNVIPFPSMRANAKLGEAWARETKAQNDKLGTHDEFPSPMSCLDEIIRRRGLPRFTWPASWPGLAERCRAYSGDVVIVTGPTGAGKTSFAIQVGLAFTGGGIPVIWCALELDPNSITERIVANMHGTHTMAIKEYWERDRIAHSLAAVTDMWRFVKRIMDTEQQLAAVRRCIALVWRIYQVKPLVVIDYLGKLAAMAKDIRLATIQAAELVRALAVDEECFVLMLAQPSRAKNQALTGKVDHASAADTSGSAAESGEAENAAAIEINLEVFKADDAPELDARWNVAKSRHVGREGKVGARFSKAGGVWSELDYIPAHPLAAIEEEKKQKADKHRTEKPQSIVEIRRDLNATAASDAAAMLRARILEIVGRAGQIGLEPNTLRSRGLGRMSEVNRALQELERATAICRTPEGRWRVVPR